MIKFVATCSPLDHMSSFQLNIKLEILFGRSPPAPPTHFSTSVYLRDNATANPLQGQCLYWMIVSHCLFILPADVISSRWRRPLTCHLPPIVAMV